MKLDIECFVYEVEFIRNIDDEEIPIRDKRHVLATDVENAIRTVKIFESVNCIIKNCVLITSTIDFISQDIYK